MKYRIRIVEFASYSFIIMICLTGLSCGERARSTYPSVEELKSRVNSHLKDKNFAEAIGVCDSIIEVDNSDSWGHIRKAVALYHLAKYTESVSLLDEALFRDSASFDAYYWRGNGRKITGDTAGALSDYNKALVLDPNSALVLSNRGSLYVSLKMNERAIIDFKKAIKADTTFLMAWNNLGNTYARMGYYDSAVSGFTDGIAIEGSGDLYHGRGLAYYESKQFDLAITDFTQAILYDPNSSLIYLHRAYAYAEIGKRTQMCEDLSKAWELGNDEAKRYYLTTCESK
ncbi:MAG TPA: tetratricopeptide repeat protein [Bacteroidia bacterium]|nr:tetratricopeptide repeat protein [Bacteroidia bacterium]